MLGPFGRWALVSIGVAGCGGGGGGTNPGTTAFQVRELSVQDGAVWPINREIVLSFTLPVDFATVSLNTIQIRWPRGSRLRACSVCATRRRSCSSRPVPGATTCRTLGSCPAA